MPTKDGITVLTNEEMKERMVYCNCLELPCVHNPEIPDEIAIVHTFRGYQTKKGVIYFFFDRRKFKIIEESGNTVKMQLLP